MEEVGRIQSSVESDLTLEKGDFELKKQNVVVEIDRILANDLSVLIDFIDSIVNGFSRQNEKDLFSKMLQTAGSEKNTIDLSQSGSTANAFLKILESSEFSVDSNGNVVMPTALFKFRYISAV